MGCIMCFFPCLECENSDSSEISEIYFNEEYIKNYTEKYINNYLKNRFNYLD